MKHTDLADKEVDGVIDHSNRSVTKEKLAHDIDAHNIGFDAAWVDGLNFRWETTETHAWLEPGEVYTSFHILERDRWYFLLPFHYGSPGPQAGGRLVWGLASAPGGVVRFFFKNLGTGVIEDIGLYARYLETLGEE